MVRGCLFVSKGGWVCGNVCVCVCACACACACVCIHLARFGHSFSSLWAAVQYAVHIKALSM